MFVLAVNGPNEDGIAVCKLDSYTQLVKDTKKKEKEIRTNQKARSLKDVFVGVWSLFKHIFMLMLLHCRFFVRVVLISMI